MRSYNFLRPNDSATLCSRDICFCWRIFILHEIVYVDVDILLLLRKYSTHIAGFVQILTYFFLFMLI